MKHKLSVATKLVSGVIIAAAVLVSVHLALFLTRPASSTKEYREVLIPEGMNFRQVAGELEESGVISHKETFIILGRLKDVTRKIRAGFYSFSTGMKPLEVLEILKKGRVIEHQVVIPEGYDLMKVAQTLEDAGLAPRGEFLAKANDPDYVDSLGLAGETLEGYLFPATYFFPKGTSLDGMIKQMVTKFRSVFNETLKLRADEVGMTELQALTLASLIERESSIDSERLLISAVFHNRLRENIPLQCDPCVIYALQRQGRWYGDLNKQNLRTKDPYNTYVYRGLPPGPIANPGKPSIIAALYPADVDYIFFVSRNDGTHYFSNNLADHNRAVMEFQKLAKLKNRSTVEAAVVSTQAAGTASAK